MPAVAGKQDKGRRPSTQRPGPVGKKGKTGGTGKKTKVFSESLGIQHLLKLSNDIAAEQASKLNERVDRARDKQAWQKERNVQKNGGGKTVDLPESQDAGWAKAAAPTPKVPMSKSSIRASIVADQRDKKKKRKEARKAAFNAGQSDTGDAGGHIDDAADTTLATSSKRVKFA